jgi:hypothetical protein
VIFNYDLPWNPMRVEQRIGRLDRYGQRHEKILIYNFSMIGTIDDEILNRLYRRINVFERFIGDLEAILGEQITELTRDIFNTKLTHYQKIHKIEKIAENIVRRQKELEAFEKECQKFIGQDEYFNQEVTNILKAKRFITSDEVNFFLRFFLKKEFPKVTLLPVKSGRADVFVLKPEDNFRKFIKQYSYTSDNIKELERKISFDGGFLITLNDQEACRDESLEFITIHHPIIKAIKRYYDESSQQIYNTAQFLLKGDSKYQGNYFFFIFLLEKAALKKDLILIPILVNLKNNKVNKVHIAEEICVWFLSAIVTAESIDDNLAIYNDELFEKAFKETGEYLEMIREEEEQKLNRNNNTLINNQIESVKQAATIKIGKAEEIIKKLKFQGINDEDRIIRLHRGRMRNVKNSMEEKIKELEKKRPVSVAFNLIAGGMVKIKSHSNLGRDNVG